MTHNQRIQAKRNNHRKAKRNWHLGNVDRCDAPFPVGSKPKKVNLKKRIGTLKLTLDRIAMAAGKASKAFLGLSSTMDKLRMEAKHQQETSRQYRD